MITCKRCGKDNQDHYKYCLGCGSEIAAAGGEGVGREGVGQEGVGQEGVGTMRTMMPNTPPRTPTPPSGVPPYPGQSPQAQPPHAPPPQAPPYGAPPAGGPPPPQPPPGSHGAPLPGVPGGGPPPAAPPQGGFAPPQGGPPPAAPPSAGPPTGARACPSCATEVPPGFKFCGACGTKLEDAPPPAAQPAPAPASQGALTLIRPDGSEGGTHPLAAGENTIGRDQGDLFESDGYLSPSHADIVVDGARAVVRDRGSLNGVFVRMTQEEELLDGQIIRVGQELLRFDFLDSPEPMKDGTEVMGSPNPGYWGKVTVVIGDGIDGSAYPILGESITLGRERGDINFPDDGYVSGLHARLRLRDGRAYLEDLGSSNGTFLKIEGEREIRDDSFVLLGQQLFRVTLG